MSEAAKLLYAETCGCGGHVIIVVETHAGEKVAAPLPLEKCLDFAKDLLDLVEKSKDGGGIPMARKH